MVVPRLHVPSMRSVVGAGIALLLASCGPNTGSTTGGDDGGGSGGTTTTATTASASSGTGSGTDAGTSGIGTGSSGGTAGTGGSTATTGSATTGGAGCTVPAQDGPCVTCQKTRCCDPIAACAADPDCACQIECARFPGDPAPDGADTCLESCGGGTWSPLLEPIRQCGYDNCPRWCFPTP